MIVLFASIVAFSCDSGGEGRERPSSYSGPQIEVDAIEHDFGECFLGHQRQHVFTLTNSGTEKLRITDVKRECGCLTPEFSSKEISPGSSATMKVVFSPPVIGPISKRIRVYTNDSFAKETIVTLKALSLGPAHLQPAVVTVDEDVPPAGITRNLTLRVDRSEVIKAVSFLTDCSWLRFEVMGDVGLSEVPIQLSILPPPAVGKVFEKVVVDISTEGRDGKNRRFALPLPFQVIGKLRPLIYAVPDVLQIGVRPIGAETIRKVKIAGFKGRCAVTTDGLEGLTASLEGEDLTVRVSSGEVGRMAGRVVLEDEGGVRLILPVLGVSR